MRPRLLLAVPAAVLPLVLASCAAPADPPAPSTAPPGTPSATGTPAATGTPSAPSSPTATTPPEPRDPSPVATGLTSPWGLARYAETIFVTERDTGRILRLDGDRAVELARVGDVDASSEGGLLGLAINPAGDGLFVYYSTARDNRIARYPFDGRAITGDPEVILDNIPVASIHNGGQLAFGPDELLYASTGDATERGSAQDRNSLSGKILRLTQDGRAAPDNPFDNEVFSLGHRNVQGLAFDDSGRLFASEFGQNTFDELNLIERGGNYGWPEVEGTQGSDGDEFIAPLRVWRTDQASPSGLAHARGSLWIAGLRGERLWEIPLTADGTGEPRAHFADEYGRLRAVLGEGDSLLVGTSNTDGRGDPRDGDDKILRVALG